MSAKRVSPATQRRQHAVQHDSHVLCFARFRRDEHLHLADRSYSEPLIGDVARDGVKEPSEPVAYWWDPDRETADAEIVDQILRWWQDGKLWRIRENLRQSERSALAMGRWLFGPRQFTEYLEAMLWAELRWRGWRLAASMPPVGKAEKKILAFDQWLGFIGSFRRLESKDRRRPPAELSEWPPAELSEFAKMLRTERLLERTDPSRTPTLAEAFQAPSVWEALLLLRREYARARGAERRRIEGDLVSFIKAVGTAEGRTPGAVDPKPRQRRERIPGLRDLESNPRAKDAVARRALKIEKAKRISRGGLKQEFENLSKQSDGRAKPATFRKAYYQKPGGSRRKLRP